MNLPPLKKIDVAIGYSGIELVNEAEINFHQIGYSVTSDGESLIGNEDRDWKENGLSSVMRQVVEIQFL
jgi:hypothetical protein